MKDAELRLQAYHLDTERLKVTGANEEQIKAITSELVTDMLGENQGLGDKQNAAEVEPASVTPPAATTEPQPPAASPPEMQALIEGQQQMMAAIQQLIQVSMLPKKRTAVRDDKTGLLLHSLETVEQPKQETLQ
jgi:hypothetical protein